MPLSEWILPSKLDSGISLEAQLLGLVPELEAREAAVYTLIPWDQWVRLDSIARAYAVAHYRVHLSIQSHMHDAAEQKSKSDAARDKARRSN
jgi:hypothetical protein